MGQEIIRGKLNLEESKQLLPGKSIRWIIVGSSSKRKAFYFFAKERGLEKLKSFMFISLIQTHSEGFRSFPIFLHYELII